MKEMYAQYEDEDDFDREGGGRDYNGGDGDDDEEPKNFFEHNGPASYQMQNDRKRVTINSKEDKHYYEKENNRPNALESGGSD